MKMFIINHLTKLMLLAAKLSARLLGQRYIIFYIYLNNLVTCVMMNEPRFAQPIPNVTVAVGRDANLPCIVEHLGGFKVAWIHIDRQMILTIHRHVISRIPRYSITYDNANTWLLHVNQAHQDDRGYYMCQVNTNPMISQVGYLQVVVPPNILDIESTPSSVAVRENQNINMTCRADGFPTPKIIWRREDGEEIVVEKKKKVLVYDGEVLPLSKVSRNEMGAYLCIATNGVPPSVSKRIILDVEFSPMIWVPNQLVGAPAGTDVSIDCHTEAHPKAIIYWVFNSVMVLPSKKYKTDYTENSYRAHMKLTIRNLQYGDFGNYRCISKNSLGETEGSIRVYDIPLPSTPSKQVTHSNIEHQDSSNQAMKHNNSETAHSETYSFKPDVYAGLAGLPPSFSSATSAAAGTQIGTASFANMGNAGGSPTLNIIDSNKHTERKGSLAIGKTMFHTEHPPSDVTVGSLSGSKILLTNNSLQTIIMLCTLITLLLQYQS